MGPYVSHAAAVSDASNTLQDDIGSYLGPYSIPSLEVGMLPYPSHNEAPRREWSGSLMGDFPLQRNYPPVKGCFFQGLGTMRRSCYT